MQSNDVFELYKPLRNHLRKTSLLESLRVMWAYSRYLQFDKQIPDDIEVTPKVRSGRKMDYVSFLNEWALETLVREIIINSQETTTCAKTVREWNYLAGALNKLRELENSIYGKFGTDQGIHLEIHRIAHRQFPWQSRPSTISMTRYFKIFGYAPLDKITQDVIGLTTKELYLIGTAVLAVYLKEPILSYPPHIGVKGITLENLKRVLNRFSCELTTLKNKLLSEQEMNEKFAYSYHSLRAYPIMKMTYNNKDSYVCPLPTLFVWRLTSGIYYEIYKEEGFDNAFGRSFQNYIGEVLKNSNVENKININPEEEYYVGRERKDTIDWIADEAEAALFIECKTKRMTILAKVALNSEEALDKDLDILADAVIQAYENINNYRNNEYPNYKFNKEKMIFPLVVTLEEWYLFIDKIREKVGEKVKEKFNESSLPVSWLNELPYSICSTQEFEELMQIIQIVGIKKFMSSKVFDREKRSWLFSSYMSSDFPEELNKTQFLFEANFNTIFPQGVIEK